MATSRPTPRATPAPASSPTPSHDRERLRTLVGVLGAVDRRPGGPATIVRVVDDLPGDPDGDLELGFLCLEAGDHPLAFLAGFVAPPDWWALGVVCTGRARHLDHRAEDPVPVRVAQVVSRRGAWASCWAPIGPEPDGDDAADDTEVLEGPAAPVAAEGSTDGDAHDAPTGRVDDALRRALGLATPAPPPSTAPLWAAQWLDALLAEAVGPWPGRRTRRRRPLASLLAAHPAVTAFDLEPTRLTVTSLVGAGERLSTLRGWPNLRKACADGRWHDPEVPAELAAWLDDGAFARWALGGYPDLVQLRNALADLLAPSALSVIDDALAGWSLATDHGAS